LIGGAEILSGGDSSQQQARKETRAGTPSDQMGQFVSAVMLGSTDGAVAEDLRTVWPSLRAADARDVLGYLLQDGFLRSRASATRYGCASLRERLTPCATLLLRSAAAHAA
jgi:hypothetical protein